MAHSDTFMLDSTDDDDADVSIARVLHVVEERTLVHDYYSMLTHPLGVSPLMFRHQEDENEVRR
jgi:hypothetical protein